MPELIKPKAEINPDFFPADYLLPVTDTCKIPCYDRKDIRGSEDNLNQAASSVIKAS
jgi:hypothetical protein